MKTKKLSACVSAARIHRYFQSRHIKFSPLISVLVEAAETIWRQVNMAIVKSFVLLQLPTGALCFLLKKCPFILEFQIPVGQKVSRLLATSSKILANS